jgi:hypothetical protein
MVDDRYMPLPVTVTIEYRGAHCVGPFYQTIKC